MSYGESAPELDFTQFHVACLSGRNGQGKSALLDAMTWALWGEARKTSDARKPDEHLLRHGSRQMSVSFTFDVSGERYRVTRIHQRTKGGNGKTTCEVQVLDEATGEFRPLTGGSLRETDKLLERIVGIDYQTFINSAFLLQGRSDEFTRKKATERKQILTGILDLSRYDRLGALAGEKLRAAKSDHARAEVETGRLQAALEPAASWKESLEACGVRIVELDAKLKAARERLAGLDREVALREAQERELEGVRGRLKQVEADVQASREDAARLTKRLEEADALVAQADTIQADYDKHLALTEERQALDERRTLYDALAKQIAEFEQKRRDRLQQAERDLERLRLQAEQTSALLADCKRQQMEAPALRDKLRAATDAEAERDRLLAARKKHEHRASEIQRLDRALFEETQARKSKVTALGASITKLEAALEEAKQAEGEAARLDADAKRRDELAQQRDARREEGIQRGATQKQYQAEAERITKAIADVRAKIDRIGAVDEDTCPTCGTELTDAHREQVRAGYRAEIEALEKQRAEAQAKAERVGEDLAKLRADFVALRKRVTAFDGLDDRRARLAHLRAHAKEQREDLAAQREELATAESELRGGTFAQPQRERLAALREEAEAQPFDPAALDRATQAAGAAPGLKQRLRQIDEAAGREDQLEERLAALAQQTQTAREALDSKALVRDLDRRLETLGQQRASVGFDAERHDAVARALRDLREAPRQMQRLVGAQQSREADRTSLARTTTRLAALTEERTGLEGRVEKLGEALARTKALPASQKAAAKEIAQVEAERSGALAEKGRYAARLEQASADRKALAEARKSKRAAEAGERLYKHLRQAFGQHGIPSLIIEETLPEIEERANELLGQLSEGRMSVRLLTLKDKKGGGTKETLDIVISDEQGVSRPYETYSGGEAFRVNFALRLALSQLLAERSGVQIRTLCIDEGFGTQDEEGIEHLIEAIQAVQNDFDKILVITHLGALKQAFPVRIEVEKRAGVGSTFELIGV